MQHSSYISLIFALSGALTNGLHVHIPSEVTHNRSIRARTENVALQNVRSGLTTPSVTDGTIELIAQRPRNESHNDILPSGNAPRKKKLKSSYADGTGSKNDKVAQKSNVSVDETSPNLVRYDKGDTIRLRCRIPTGPYLVMWNKMGLDYPLTIGTTRFVPDDRVQARFKSPDKWRLSIMNAQLNDSGVYRCTTSSQDSLDRLPATNTKEHPRKEIGSSEELEEITNTTQSKVKNNDYYVTVVEPKPTDRFQVDAPASETGPKRNKTIVVTGPKIVFYGSSFELVCRATFPTNEAKLNPQIILEWYHRGIRRRPSLARSGGVYITERWLDSHLLESRLLIAWASEADAGQWICLDRSNTYPRRDGLLLTPHETNKPNTGLSGEINLTPIHGLPQPDPVEDMADPSTQNQLAFDRIEVEIIDLPDPTRYPPPYLLNRGTTPKVPTFAIMEPLEIGPQHASLRAARAGSSADRSLDSLRTSKRERNAAFSQPLIWMPIQISAIIVLSANFV